MKKNVIVKYIGCRLNQFETDHIKNQFISDGYSEVKNDADICIVNTCTVTHNADRKSRNLIRKLKKANPNAFLIATGCMVETNKEDLKKMNIIDRFVKNDHKLDIINKIKDNGYNSKNSFVLYTVERTRPHIKIQDGCNNFCSYCKVRFARGKSRSEDYCNIIKTAQYLADNNYKEIVLTGVNIGDYNYNGKTLKHLLNDLINIKNLQQIRLSSIEPTNIDNDLIDIFKHNKICKYFHIPLQSGSNKILKLMKRPYEISTYKSIIDKIQKINNNVIIGTDIIVGFPGEDEIDFNHTYNLLKDNNIFYLHIFRYSSREKTEASLMKNTVSETKKYLRYKILEDYEKSSKNNFFNGLLNKNINILIENKIINKKYLSGLSSNYISVLLPYKKYKNQIGQIKNVLIKKILEDKLYAE